MEKPDSKLQESFSKCVWKAVELMDSGMLSDSTVLKICDGTQTLSSDKRRIFYQQLSRILENATTEQEILEEGIAIRDSLLNGPSDDVLDTLHDLSQILQVKCLDEKTLSNDSMITIIHPMQNMAWDSKALYGKKLINILKTANTEDEILVRAYQIQIYT